MVRRTHANSVTPVRAVLLDIEGTTTPVEFVYEVLFPYARGRVRQFLLRHRRAGEIRAVIEALKQEYSRDRELGQDLPAWKADSDDSELESVAVYVHWLMDRDRKSTPLKSLQGRIWEAGYRSGELRGQVYADVPGAFARWASLKKDIAIFSSGSVLAQKLLFSHSTEGDLTRFICAYFDTTTGPKNDAASYRRIVAALELASQELLFLSDVVAELDAARLSGMRTALCIRPGRAESESTVHCVIRSFDEVPV